MCFEYVYQTYTHRMCTFKFVKCFSAAMCLSSETVKYHCNLLLLYLILQRDMDRALVLGNSIYLT